MDRTGKGKNGGKGRKGGRKEEEVEGWLRAGWGKAGWLRAESRLSWPAISLLMSEGTTHNHILCGSHKSRTLPVF